jgi:cell division protein FtsB
MTNRIKQAYHQAPWRVQTQWLGLFLLALLLIASVAGIYLDISSRAAKTGRDIQGLDAEIESKERRIADLRTELAILTTTAEMEKRAQDLGFVKSEPGTAEYIPVPGYQERQPAMLAPVPSQDMVQHPILEPRYTESLLQWLFKAVLNSQPGGQPTSAGSSSAVEKP